MAGASTEISAEQTAGVVDGTLAAEVLVDETMAALAARIYAYRLLHIVFGSEPSVQELQLLGSDETRQACEALAAVGYGVEGLSLPMAVLAEGESDEALAERLRSQFTRLFAVPGENYVKPWESVYVGKTDVLFTSTTLDVRQRYEALGFRAQEKGHFPEDHLSMMLDFMAAASERTYEAAVAGDAAKVARLLKAQDSFAEHHLLNWLPLLCDTLQAKDDTGFFAASAAFTRRLLTDDRSFVHRLNASLEDYSAL